MHLQENTLYYIDQVVNVIQNVVQYPPNHMTYAPAKFEGYVQQYGRRWIYKKVHYMLLT